MDTLEHLEQSIDAYKKKKEEYFLVFDIDNQKAIELARQIELALKPISEALHNNFPIIIENKKALKQIEDINQRSDSLFKFYNDKQKEIWDKRFAEIDTTLLDDLIDEVTAKNSNKPDEVNYPQDILEDVEDFNDELFWLYDELKKYYGEKIVDITVLAKHTDLDVIDIILENGMYCDGISARKHRLGHVFTKKNLERGLQKYFNLIGDSYLFAQYESVVIFCQSLLEELYQNIYEQHNVKNLKLGLLIESAYGQTEMPEDIVKIKKIHDLANAIKHNIFKNGDDIKDIETESFNCLRISKELFLKNLDRI